MKQHKRHSFFLFLPWVAFILISLAPIHSLNAIEIRLNSPHRVYADAKYVYCDALGSPNIISPETTTHLKYNIPITITFFLELHEKKFFFFSTLRTKREIVHLISYDIWSESYLIQTSGSVKRYANIETLRSKILHLEKIPLAKTSEIQKHKKYFIKSRVTLKIKNKLSHYNILNNFLSIFKYRTTYYKSRTYSGNELLQPHSPYHTTIHD